jgi:hypothetical protein
MFKRKPKRHRKLTDQERDDMVNPLVAVPVKESGVESQVDSTDRAQIRRRLPPKPGLYGWLSRKVGYKHDVHFKLDEYGTAFWSQIDGRKDLRTIATHFKHRIECDQEQAQRACVTYARDLMVRRLICLRLPHKPGESRKEIRIRR